VRHAQHPEWEGATSVSGSERSLQQSRLPLYFPKADRFHRRSLGPIGNIPPGEAEENFYAQRDVLDVVA